MDARCHGTRECFVSHRSVQRRMVEYDREPRRF